MRLYLKHNFCKNRHSQLNLLGKFAEKPRVSKFLQNLDQLLIYERERGRGSIWVIEMELSSIKQLPYFESCIGHNVIHQFQISLVFDIHSAFIVIVT